MPPQVIEIPAAKRHTVRHAAVGANIRRASTVVIFTGLKATTRTTLKIPMVSQFRLAVSKPKPRRREPGPSNNPCAARRGRTLSLHEGATQPSPDARERLRPARSRTDAHNSRIVQVGRGPPPWGPPGEGGLVPFGPCRQGCRARFFLATCLLLPGGRASAAPGALSALKVGRESRGWCPNGLRTRSPRRRPRHRKMRPAAGALQPNRPSRAAAVTRGFVRAVPPTHPPSP
eukprot:scaffold1306_cov399-Prasinococcus_capsulatus_cf.AAC.14